MNLGSLLREEANYELWRRKRVWDWWVLHNSIFGIVVVERMHKFAPRLVHATLEADRDGRLSLQELGLSYPDGLQK